MAIPDDVKFVYAVPRETKDMGWEQLPQKRAVKSSSSYSSIDLYEYTVKLKQLVSGKNLIYNNMLYMLIIIKCFGMCKRILSVYE